MQTNKSLNFVLIVGNPRMDKETMKKKKGIKNNAYTLQFFSFFLQWKENSSKFKHVRERTDIFNYCIQNIIEVMAAACQPESIKNVNDDSSNALIHIGRIVKRSETWQTKTMLSHFFSPCLCEIRIILRELTSHAYQMHSSRRLYIWRTHTHTQKRVRVKCHTSLFNSNRTQTFFWGGDMKT